MHAQENDPDAQPARTDATAEEHTAVAAPATGVRALTSDHFSIAESIGGVRGVVESMAPGLVFVVVYVVTGELMPPLIASLAVAVLAVVARLVQRTPLTQAFGGLLGVGIGVYWAWKSGDATQYFAWGLWTNGGYLAVMLVSVLASWPVVGLVVEGLRAGFGLAGLEQDRDEDTDEDVSPAEARATARAVAAADAAVASTVSGESADKQPGPFAQWAKSWRSDPELLKRYTIATWLWIAMFAVRLAVQIPLFLNSEVGWLGTARLVMGIPLWGLVLWGTWVLVRPREAHGAQRSTPPVP